MLDWRSFKPKSQKTPRMEQYEDVIEWPNGEWKRVRPIGPPIGVANHWLVIRTKSGTATFPKMCLNYNPYTGSFDRNRYKNNKLVRGCPYCENHLPVFVDFFSNFIDRDLQRFKPAIRPKPLPEERQPRQLLGTLCRFKVKGSPTWTPIKLGRMTPKLADRLENLVQLNRHANPKNPAQWKCFSLSHPRYGTDVLIRCDRGPPVVYDCQKDEATELTDAELKYLWWNLDCLRPELFADAMRSFHSLKHRLIDESDDYVHGHLRRYHRQRNDDWLTYDPSDDDTDEL